MEPDGSGAMDISWGDEGRVKGCAGGEEEDARGVGRGSPGCSRVVVVGELGSEPEAVVK
jgi:hypothetical protein